MKFSKAVAVIENCIPDCSWLVLDTCSIRMNGNVGEIYSKWNISPEIKMLVVAFKIDLENDNCVYGYSDALVKVVKGPSLDNMVQELIEDIRNRKDKILKDLSSKRDIIINTLKCVGGVLDESDVNKNSLDDEYKEGWKNLTSFILDNSGVSKFDPFYNKR